MWPIIGVAAAAAAAWIWIDRGKPRTVIDATVVDSRFQQERGADGRTLTTIRTVDGRLLTLSRPGRNLLAAGDTVRAELVGGHLRRLVG
jgi:hypothetical protein